MTFVYVHGIPRNMVFSPLGRQFGGNVPQALDQFSEMDYVQTSRKGVHANLDITGLR